MSLSAPHSSYDSPLQLKGEVMDLEFSPDADHRKRRRNRTTQSCLNCHTSKRKCDRKRPCQRCIQLGLTGLCVYEIDDPAARDDPSLDESTRLRNRIAELESLVRELRGKPHPRWAEGNLRDGDQSERWHSRAAKYCSQVKRGGTESDPVDVDELPDHDGRIPAIKVEDSRSSLYGFGSASPSSSSSLRYNNFQSEVPSPPSSIIPFDNTRRSSYDASTRSAMSYSSSSTAIYHQQQNQQHDSASSYSGGSGGYDQSDFSEDFQQRYGPASPPIQSFCACRSNPGTAPALIALNRQLQNSTSLLRQYANHTPDSHCMLYRRIAELNNLMQLSGGSGRGVPVNSGTTYGPGALPTPTDSEMMSPSPLSSTSSPFDPPSAGHQGHDWAAIAAQGYNPYFPIPSADTAMQYTN